ncbi:MAG: four helix bundle protein [Bacteroidetes bacterium]|nr:four helix bundle protein [Bacteroidota bacterium]
MSEKEIFIEKLKNRTRKFAVDIIMLCNSLKTCNASSVITYQLVKAATSSGANYRPNNYRELAEQGTYLNFLAKYVL